VHHYYALLGGEPVTRSNAIALRCRTCEDRRVPGFSLDSHLVRREDLLSAPVDQELVMLDPAASRYYRLDPIGLRVWELLGQVRSLDAICAALEPEFEVSAEQCRADVIAFLDRLQHAGLVEPAS
jgi:Coenzyme PQQ synthesis protein D (PqqD)